MAGKRKPGAVKGSPEWRERVGRGQRRAAELRRATRQITPAALKALKRGDVDPSLLPYLDAARAEVRAWAEALGGPERITPQVASILEDASTAGLFLRALAARAMQRPRYLDRDAGKVSTLLAARRASLQTVGLDRLEHEVDLRAYVERKRLEEREDDAQATNADAPDGEPVDENEGAQGDTVEVEST